MKVFLLGQTQMNREGIGEYLKHKGYTWSSTADNASLVELMGRACYSSFEGTDNRNINKIREGNQKYLKNIIDSGHGSVLEHVTWNFMFTDVSRVLTHELVRHRNGAFSQQSGRYCLLTAKAVGDMYEPPEIEQYGLKDWWDNALHDIVGAISAGTEVVDQLDVPFSVKKKLTSAVRRIAPNGSSNDIGWTTNARELRFVLQQRTDPSAEIEIRELFNMVWDVVKDSNLMQSIEVVPDKTGELSWIKGGKI